MSYSRGTRLLGFFAITIATVAHAAPNMSPPPPGVTPPAAQPKTVAGFVMKGQELAHAMIRLPADILSRMTPGPARGMYKVCVGTEGKVSGVSTLTSIAGADDEVAMQIRTGWAYRPRTEPVCFFAILKVKVPVPAEAQAFGKPTVDCSTTSADLDKCIGIARGDEVAGREVETRILDRFCRAGQPKACAALGNCITMQRCSGGHRMALDALHKACDAKLGEACYDLGWAELQGWDPSAKGQPILDLLSHACDLGSGDACSVLFGEETCRGHSAEAQSAADRACALGQSHCERVHKVPSCRR